MLQYVWIIMLWIIYVAWTIRSIVDGIQWIYYQWKWGDEWNSYGGWAIVWIVLHLAMLFAVSLTQYTMARGLEL